MEAVHAAYAPERRGKTTPASGETGYRTWSGGDQAAWRQWYEAFDDVQFEWDEVADAGDDVVVTYRAHARGRGSGAVVDQAFTLLWTLRAGKVVHIRAYADRTAALEAAGLRE